MIKIYEKSPANLADILLSCPKYEYGVNNKGVENKMNQIIGIFIGNLWVAYH